MTGKLFIFLFLAAFGAAAIYTWKTTTPPTHIVLDLDGSGSVGTECSGLVRSTEELLTGSTIQSGSTLTVLVMGKSALAPEPRPLFTAEIPVLTRDVYGEEIAQQEYRKAKAALLTKVRQACEVREGTMDSPILRLVQRGVEHLRQSCTDTAICHLLVKTDLIEENGERRLALAIARAAQDEAVALPTELAGSIDNAGIHVRFCGLAEVAPRRPGTPLQAPSAVLKRLWTGLFTTPDLVSFEPFCGAVGKGDPHL